MPETRGMTGRDYTPGKRCQVSTALKCLIQIRNHPLQCGESVRTLLSQTHARENCDPRRENKRTLRFNGAALRATLRRVYHFSPPCNLTRGFLDQVRGGRLHLLIRKGPPRRPVGRYGAVWIATCARGQLKEPVRAARKIRGGLLCQSALINRANAGAPRRTVFACA
jgi:hypothetical protein